MAKKENSLKGLRNKGKKLLTGANWSKRKEQSDPPRGPGAQAFRHPGCGRSLLG